MAVKIPDVNTVDFETDGIERRPKYPPKPKSVSIQLVGEKKPTFYAWGHPEGNNCDESKPKAILRDLRRDPKQKFLYQNGNFDEDVQQHWWDFDPISWERIHDTLFLMFLWDPHSRSLQLKPMSEKHLGMKPDERDDVRDWILAHKRELELQYGPFKPKEWGFHIAHVPGQIVGPYADGDVSRTLKMFRYLYPRIVADDMLASYDRERELAPIMLENEREGTKLDIITLKRDIKVYTQAQLDADNWLRKRLKNQNIDFEKDAQIADALEQAGVVTSFKMTPTGKRSVSKKNMTVDMFNDQLVASVLGYRNRLQTSLTTFMRPWLALAQDNAGRLHTSWNQVRNSEGGGGGARTGRMSCSPNLMNIPTEWYGKGDGYAHPVPALSTKVKAAGLPNLPELPVIRSYVLPDQKDHVFAGRDYNQQELRILGHFEDGLLMQAYQDNPELDTHTFVQDEIQAMLHRDVPRKVIKEINFGTIYGQGAPSLAEKLGESIEMIKTIKSAQLRALPGLKDLNDNIKRGAKQDIPIRTWGGRLYYKEPSVVINGRLVDFGYKLLNYLIQGSAADCTKQGIINYSKVKKEGRFLCSVHDENNISVPKKAAKQELLILRDAMADVTFDVQMLSEPYMGPNWGAIEKYKEAK
jgi:DNA polymerase I-like protein with 3'-5' exonuclease and polymerase domains